MPAQAQAAQTLKGQHEGQRPASHLAMCAAIGGPNTNWFQMTRATLPAPRRGGHTHTRHAPTRLAAADALQGSSKTNPRRTRS